MPVLLLLLLPPVRLLLPAVRLLPLPLQSDDEQGTTALLSSLSSSSAFAILNFLPRAGCASADCRWHIAYKSGCF